MDKIQLKKLRKDLKHIPDAKILLASEFGINVRSVTNYLHSETKKALHIRAAEMVVEFDNRNRMAEEYINSK
jgi:hypothetical protein